MVTDAQRKALRRAYRHLRDNRNLTGQAVASLVGMAPSLYSNIENGWREPTDEQRKAIARVLRVRIADLPTMAQEAAA